MCRIVNTSTSPWSPVLPQLELPPVQGPRGQCGPRGQRRACGKRQKGRTRFARRYLWQWVHQILAYALDQITCQKRGKAAQKWWKENYLPLSPVSCRVEGWRSRLDSIEIQRQHWRKIPCYTKSSDLLRPAIKDVCAQDLAVEAFKELRERKELEPEYQRVHAIAKKWGY